MSQQHTPTPYYAQIDKVYYSHPDGSGSGLVADCSWSYDGAASAAFIVTACNSHAAFVELAQAVKRLSGSGPAYWAVLEQANAALKLAGQEV